MTIYIIFTKIHFLGNVLSSHFKFFWKVWLNLNPLPATQHKTTPKKIIARVPTLPAGEYLSRMITRFSNSTQLLKETRTIEHDKKLIVDA